MKPQNSKHEFEALSMQRELPLTALTVDQACKAMLDFYRLHRAEGCDVSADGDSLLYQWDVVDIDEHGRCLEWNLTRQFMLAETFDEESDDSDDDEEEIHAADSPNNDDSNDDDSSDA